MITLHTVIPAVAGVVLFMAVDTGVTIIAPPPVEPRIVVHSLAYTFDDDRPFIAQHRTVEAENAITAVWSARITEDGKTVCRGSGNWDYSSGDQVARISFDKWVGEKGCYDKLVVGTVYQASAEYKWGDGKSTRQTTIGFTK